MSEEVAAMNAPATGLDALEMTCLVAGTVAAEIRQRIVLRLSAWDLMRLSDDIQLVADELVVNACRITPRGRVGVRFCRENAGSVLLAVWDASDDLPSVRPVRDLELDDLDLCEENFDRNGGWGLQLVRSLASECGVLRTSPSGKWVWARFAT